MKSHKNSQILDTRNASIVALVLSLPFYVHGEEHENARASRARQVLSLAVPSDVRLWDWTWEGTTIVSSEGKSGVRLIETLDFSGGTLRSTKSSVYQHGELPVVIGEPFSALPPRKEPMLPLGLTYSQLRPVPVPFCCWTMMRVVEWSVTLNQATAVKASLMGLTTSGMTT